MNYHVKNRAWFLSALVLLMAWVSPQSANAETVKMSGVVQSSGGPVGPFTVTLYRAGDQLGSGEMVLGSATTADDGCFSFPYTPPSDQDAVLYAIAVGPRPTIQLATVLGTALVSNEIIINERTTVATAYAMAQFIVDGKIGGKSPGLQNASKTLRNLVNPGTGEIGDMLGTSPNGLDTSTMPLFNSLANLLAGCVNAVVDCEKLFALMTPPDGVAPGNTLQAAVNVAHFSWQNPIELFMASLIFSPYGPALTSPPMTWTLALKYVGNGQEFDGPGAMAIDANGDVWANNNYIYQSDPNLPTCAGTLLSKLTATGLDAPRAPYEGSAGGLSGAGFGIGLDPNGDVWLGNFGFFGAGCKDYPPADSVSQFDQQGDPISKSSGYTQGCNTATQATVSDQQGNIWMANQCSGTVTQYKAGADKVADPDDFWVYDVASEKLISVEDCRAFSGTGPKPFAIAIDGDGNAWVSNNAGDAADASVFKLDPDGSLIATAGPSQGINRPLGVAADSVGNVWVSNSAIISLPCANADTTEDYCQIPGSPPDCVVISGAPSVTKLDSAANEIGTYRGGGLFIPWGNAVDGNDDLWVANFGGHRVSHFSKTGDPIAPHGYHSNALQRNTGVSIDPSGNVWLANNWLNDPIPSNPGGDGLVVFIGLAAPVKTPLIGPPQQP